MGDATEFRVSVIPGTPKSENRGTKGGVFRGATKDAADIMSVAREETGEELPIGGNAEPCAIPAEGPAYRGNDADFAGPISMAPPSGRLARMGGRDRLEWKDGLNGGQDFSLIHHLPTIPMVGFPNVHELDEPQGQGVFLGPGGEGKDLPLVHAPLNHAVDLHAEPEGSSSRDPGEDPFDLCSHAIHSAEGVRVQSIQADRDPGEAGKSESFRVVSEKYAVCGKCDVVDSVDRRQHGDQIRDPTPHQRFTARQPDLTNSEAGGDTGESDDFLEAEDLVAGQKRMVRPEVLGWHAVAAAEVATVRHGDAEIMQGALKGIDGGQDR